MKVYIITEGDENLGLGHLVRCLSLYNKFLQNGIRPKIIAPKNKSTQAIFIKTNYIPLNWHKKINSLKKELRNSDIIILDSPRANINSYKFVSALAKVPVFIDDNKRLKYPRGVLINRTIYAEKFGFPNNGSSYLLGTKYLPLPKEYENIKIKKIRNKLENILITFGGSDPKRTTEKALFVLIKNFPHLKKSVVLGSAYKESVRLAGVADKSTKIYRNLSSKKLIGLMLDADIAISASGQTLYELARIGTPTIAVKIAQNQKYNIAGLKQTGFLEYAGEQGSKTTYKNIVKFIKKMRDKKIREKKSNVGKKLVDGWGADRIVKFLIKKAGK